MGVIYVCRLPVEVTPPSWIRQSQLVVRSGPSSTDNYDRNLCPPFDLINNADVVSYLLRLSYDGFRDLLLSQLDMGPSCCRTSERDSVELANRQKTR